MYIYIYIIIIIIIYTNFYNSGGVKLPPPKKTDDAIRK